MRCITKPYAAGVFCIILLLLSCAVSTYAAEGLTWNAAGDWGTRGGSVDTTLRNPNGDWTYVDSATPKDAAARLPGMVVNLKDDLPHFQYFTDYSTRGCKVGRNTASKPTIVLPKDGGAWLAAGQASICSGKSRTSKYAAFRWTAPFHASIKVDALFTGNHIPASADDPGTVSTALIMKNGSKVWNGNIQGFIGCKYNGVTYPKKGSNPSSKYSGVIEVNTGDTIDFACDFTKTPAGTWAGLTGLNAAISVVKMLPPTKVTKRAVGWENSLKPKGNPGIELTLADNGKAGYTILLPAKPTSQEQKAAVELQCWLFQMTGAEFKIVRENATAKPAARYISIGSTSLLKKSGLKAANLEGEGYSIAVKDKSLFLTGGKKRGPIYAVYALLEEDLGCRWYDSYSSTIPAAKTLKFKPVVRTYNPVLDIRDPFYWDAYDVNWSLRNRTNAPYVNVRQAWGGCTDYALFVHTVFALVPPEKYFKDHPEYYCEHNGKREASQLCLTDPGLLKVMIQNVKEVLRKNPHCEIISVSPNDWTNYCECANCKAIDTAEGSNSGTLVKFCNEVADGIKGEFPDVKISTLAYLGTFMPPKTIKPNENVVIQLCTDSHAWGSPFLFVNETENFQKAMKAWGAIGASTYIWDYTTNFSHYCAIMPNMQVVDYAIKYYVDNHARGVMLQGAYQSPGDDNGALRSWVWAKKLWDPSLETKSLMKDFVFGYYGEAAQPMWEYNMLRWNLWEEYHSKPHDSSNPMITWTRYTPDIAFLSGEFLDKSMDCIKRAEAMTKDPVIRRRIDIAKLPILYSMLAHQLGYIDHVRNFVSKLGPNSDKDKLSAMVDEFERISKIEGMTHIAEGGPDAAGYIKQWKVRLRSDFSKTKVIGLSNEWKLKLDPDQKGIPEKWYDAGFDIADWANVRSDTGTGWESQGFPEYLGYAWYRQQISVPADFSDAPHVYLYLGAVDDEAEVFINGRKAFEHSVKSTDQPTEVLWNQPFIFDAKPFLNAGGTNTIAVRVNNVYKSGGVIKPVHLIATNLESDLDLIATAIQALGGR